MSKVIIGGLELLVGAAACVTLGCGYKALFCSNHEKVSAPEPIQKPTDDAKTEPETDSTVILEEDSTTDNAVGDDEPEKTPLEKLQNAVDEFNSAQNTIIAELTLTGIIPIQTPEGGVPVSEADRVPPTTIIDATGKIIPQEEDMPDIGRKLSKAFNEKAQANGKVVQPDEPETEFHE